MNLLAGIGLVCLASAVFFPILGFEFVDYDVSETVVNNPHIRGLGGENLRHIFTTWSLTSYYPIRTLTYAIDYQIWGSNPGGFKLTNVLIHLTNVLLVFWLVLRLLRHPAAPGNAPPAWWDVCLGAFSAGVFAVHPVVVEPVTWVAGREELLMTLGTLGCFHFHMTARRMGQAGGRRRWLLVCRAGAIFCCAMACLSNAVAAVIPLLITSWDVLTLGRPKRWKILRGTALLWVIGAATVAVKILGPDAATASEVGAFSLERLMAVLNVYWLNVKAIFWPTKLALSRSPITPDRFLEVDVILGGIAVGLTCLLLGKLRRRKLLLFGLVWVGIGLAPSSQIIVHHIHRADRFLYLPLVGLVIAVAVGLRPLAGWLKRRGAVTGVVSAGVLGLFLLGLLSARQVQTWRDSLSVWENCVKVDPDNAFAHMVLARNLAKRGQFRRAEQHHETARRLDYDNEEAMRTAALRAAAGEGKDLDDYALAVRLATRACELTDWKGSKYLNAFVVAHSSYAKALVTHGKIRGAVESYEKALQVSPNYRPALFQLAVVLATCREEELRNPVEAIRLAERGCRLAGRRGPTDLMILAEVYARAGRLDAAMTTVREAIQLAQPAGDTALVDQLRGLLEHYQSRVARPTGIPQQPTGE